MTPTELHRWDAAIHAFVALAEPEPQRAADPSGPLKGLTVGIKDIIDVADLPTRNGSATCAGAMPAKEDAQIVAALRNAGTQIIGKTTTTEFAFTDPTDCRNPHDLTRSPGGSSSGSGAAVAAGLVDLALGTQTAGSLCRPAAYCGVVGFKPSFGLWPTAGVTPLAPSFDTVGVIARSVDLAHRVYRALDPPSERRAAQPPVQLTTAVALFEGDLQPVSEMATALHEASDVLAGESTMLPNVSLKADADGIVTDHRTVMNHEAFAAHGHLLSDAHIKLLQPKFRAGLQAGSEVSAAQAREAKQRLTEATRKFWDHLSDMDVVLTLAVPEGAPLIDGTTGFQNWITPWTVFGGPLVCLPWGLDTLSRPMSIMLAGHPGTDAMLLSAAASLEALAPLMPAPALPEDGSAA